VFYHLSFLDGIEGGALYIFPTRGLGLRAPTWKTAETRQMGYMEPFDIYLRPCVGATKLLKFWG
jgi:hypothetical protein